MKKVDMLFINKQCLNGDNVFKTLKLPSVIMHIFTGRIHFEISKPTSNFRFSKVVS